MSKWEMVKLGDVCSSIVRGPFGSALKKEYFVKKSENTYKVYEQKNAIRKDHNIGDYYINEYKYLELKRFKVEPNDIIISCSGTIGEIYQLPFNCEKGIINQALLKLSLKDIIESRFFKYFWRASIKTISSRGSGIKNISSVKYIKDLNIPLPPLDIQKHIADTLDKAQEIIDGHNKQLEELDNLIKVVFYDMFGDPIINQKQWEEYNFTDCIIFNPSKSEVKQYDEYMEVTFVPMANVGINAEIDVSEIKILSEVYNGFTYFKENDVLLAKITPCFENGKSAIARNLKNFIGFGSTEFHVMRPIKNLTTSEWLLYFTKTDTFMYNAKKAMSGSAGQKRIQKEFFEKLKVGLPPLSLQNKFAQIVTSIEQQKSIVKQSLKESQNLFNSLMSQYFD